MSRIRPVKPEAYQSETLAELSIYAERTFFGLATECDDRGRHKDHAAIIYGKLWVVRADQTPVDVEDHLMQMERAGLIHRYTGCDGKRYLHYITWDRHQKIEKPSLSRLPSCPHCAPERCGPCKGPCTQRATASPTETVGIRAPSANPPRGFADDSANTPGALSQPVNPSTAPPTPLLPTPADASTTLFGVERQAVQHPKKTAGQAAFAESSPKAPRNLPEPSAPGSRILDPGSSSPTGREAPDDTVSANQLVGEYVATCAERPPGSVLGHLGKVTKALLAEGIAPEHVRAGLRRFAEIQGHPSRLPSLVNDAMNAPAAGLVRPGFRPNVPAYQAWTNPVDAATAYAEEL